METETQSLKTWNGQETELLQKIEDDEIVDDLMNNATNNEKIDEISTISRRSDEPTELSFEKGKLSLCFSIVRYVIFPFKYLYLI